MKTSSDFLWRLIRSMNTSEKLFFKRNLSQTGDEGRSIYKKLFDALASQKKYDENALLKKLGPAITQKNLSFTKHYLQKQVCAALVHHDSRNSVSQEIFQQIQLIRIYRQKGMTEEAHTLWKKAVMKARRTESFGLLGLLKNEFEKIVLFSNLHTRYDDMHSIFQKRSITYEEYASLMTLRDMYTETLLLKRSAHFDFDEAMRKNIQQMLLLINQVEENKYGNSFWFRHYYRMTKGTLLYLLNQSSQALPVFMECWQDWKNNTQFISEEGEFYIELLYMINYAGINLHKYEKVESIFNDDMNDLIGEESLRANFEVVKFLALNKIFNKTANYKKVEKLMDSMNLGIKKWEGLINDDLNTTIHGSLGIGCFVLNQYSEALTHLKKASRLLKVGTRQDLAATIYILLLLTTYSMNNSKLFDAQYRETYAWFYKHKSKHVYESALLKCLYRSFYLPDIKEKLAEYKSTLEILESHRDDTVQQQTFNIFNFEGWLISRIQRISYRQYVERKVKLEPLPV